MRIRLIWREDLSLLRAFEKLRAQAKARQLGLVLLPWLVVATNALMAKLQRQWVIAASVDPFYAVDHPAPSLFWQAHAFRSDLSFGFLAISCLLAVAAFAFHRRTAMASIIAVAIVTQTVVSVEMAASAVSGGFVDYKMLWLAVWWTLTTRQFTIASISMADATYCVLWFLLAVMVSAAVVRCPRERARSLHRVGMAMLLVAFVAWILLAATPTSAMAGSDPLIVRSYSALFSRKVSSELMSRSLDELYDEYRHDVHLDGATSPPKYFAAARDYNLVVFVMESMPAQPVGLEKAILADMPNIAELRKTAFVSERHYTSYPATTCALFSMFTSIYIDTTPGGDIGGNQRLPGLIRSLNDSGYETGFFGYVWKEGHDDRLLKAIGFRGVREPHIPEGAHGGVQIFAGPVKEIEQHDNEALQTMKEEIHGWNLRHQKFAAVYFPEISHDPWRNITGNSRATDEQKGHALAVRHDAWMGEIVEQLKQDGVLNHTIIVLTGDHGLRSVIRGGEHPQLVSRRTIEDITEHVPLLIYAPGVLMQTVRLTAPTSHVDLPPTLLELLGVPDGNKFEQGVPIWSDQVAKRRVYLLMSDNGADAYYENGSYYQVNSEGVTYRSGELHFDYKSLLIYDSAEAQSVRSAITQHKARQTALVHHLLNNIH